MHVKDDKGVLHEVAGDPPHIAVFHSGTQLAYSTVKFLATSVFEEWLDDARELVLDRAALSSFEGNGVPQHGVLLYLADPSCVDASRQRIRRVVGAGVYAKLTAHEPHVVAAVCATEAEARARMADFAAHLPLRVRVVGVSME